MPSVPPIAASSHHHLAGATSPPDRLVTSPTPRLVPASVAADAAPERPDADVVRHRRRHPRRLPVLLLEPAAIPFRLTVSPAPSFFPCAPASPPLARSPLSPALVAALDHSRRAPALGRVPCRAEMCNPASRAPPLAYWLQPPPPLSAAAAARAHTGCVAVPLHQSRTCTPRVPREPSSATSLLTQAATRRPAAAPAPPPSPLTQRPSALTPTSFAIVGATHVASPSSFSSPLPSPSGSL
nr:proline-rich receptor-like protein kinase PERK9 [Aegilops tauschii subsp. strangulata]